MPGVLVRIEAPHFVAGVVPGDRAAPIVHYMARWGLPQIMIYCKAKGWRCEIIHCAA